jgi:hypothetical protein
MPEPDAGEVIEAASGDDADLQPVSEEMVEQKRDDGRVLRKRGREYYLDVSSTRSSPTRTAIDMVGADGAATMGRGEGAE